MTREDLTKDIVGYEGIYTIDIFGNVFRIKDGREIRYQYTWSDRTYKVESEE